MKKTGSDNPSGIFTQAAEQIRTDNGNYLNHFKMVENGNHKHVTFFTSPQHELLLTSYQTDFKCAIPQNFWFGTAKKWLKPGGELVDIVPISENDMPALEAIAINIYHEPLFGFPNDLLLEMLTEKGFKVKA
jgi:hypothetical protein